MLSKEIPNLRLQNIIQKRNFKVIFSFHVCLRNLGSAFKSTNCNFNILNWVYFRRENFQNLRHMCKWALWIRLLVHSIETGAPKFLAFWFRRSDPLLIFTWILSQRRLLSCESLRPDKVTPSFEVAAFNLWFSIRVDWRQLKILITSTFYTLGAILSKYIYSQFSRSRQLGDRMPAFRLGGSTKV